MNNYVLLYRFDDQQNIRDFEAGIQKMFGRHKWVEDGGFKYFGFADTAEPGVVDKLNTILSDLGIARERYAGKKDYVALYFSRQKDPDNIKRQLLIGTEDMVDQDAQGMNTDAHRDAIQNILETDFVKMQQ